MAFVRPSLGDLVTRVQADFISRLSLVAPLPRRALAAVFARVVAGAAHMLHGHLEFLGRQLFPDQSDDAYLVRQAAVYGLTKAAATYAQGTITVSGAGGATPFAGLSVPSGTTLSRADGQRYATTATITFGGVLPSLGANVIALTAGAAGTLSVGDSLTFESPIGSLASIAPVSASTLDGTDGETTDSLRARLIARIANPPTGGSAADYVAWAKSVPGVTRVWVRSTGLGGVLVRFTRDLDATPAPSLPELSAVRAVITAQQPVHAVVTVAGLYQYNVNFTIAIGPNDTAATRAAITTALTDYFTRYATPMGQTIYLSDLRAAAGAVTIGVTDMVMTVPSADVVVPDGQLAMLGTITWA